VATANVESARENRRVAAERYRAGVVPSSELLDAETALLRADLELTAALSRQRLSAATLDRAVGR
jgi:outer membrane protein TolC